jgi:hypothetical protein
MKAWPIERLTTNGRVAFHFPLGGDLDDFQLLETTIQRDLGGRVTNRIDGPCGETVLDIALPDHDITLCFDGGFEDIYFCPAQEGDVERTQAFANELQNCMNARNEREWLTSTDPQAMLTFLLTSDKLSDRKARLFACAAVRRSWHLLTDERSRRAVEVAECYADGMATGEELRFAFSCAADTYTYAAASHTAEAQAVAGAANAARPEAGYYARYVTPREEHPALLRDLFGPLPFRPINLPRSVRTWNGGLVRRLAEEAYEKRQLPAGTLDPDRLVVLADALLEAGCDNADIIGHLRRQGGVHVRGCWCLDLLLTKE